MCGGGEGGGGWGVRGGGGIGYFSQKLGFEGSCRLSPSETICMKCQCLFPVKNKKENKKKCHLVLC